MIETANFVKSERRGDILAVTLDRPPLNILNIALLRELDAALKAGLAAPTRMAVLKAKGRAFSAGADVGEHLPEKLTAMLGSFRAIFKTLGAFDGIVTACVQGPALGGGCELALFADIVLASSAAAFGQPEIKLGVFPPVAMVLLPALCPGKASFELLMAGETIPAEQALRLGLVSQVFEAENFEAAAEGHLKRYETLSPSALRLTKRTLRKVRPEEFDRRLSEAETAYMNELMKLPDALEGLKSFLEKRPPEWRTP